MSAAAIAAPSSGARNTEITTTDILTPEDVASWLQVSKKWLYDHTSRCTPIVPHLRLGGHLRFRRSDIERWLDSCLEGSCA
jgi:excisionase family DNA binding protein